MPSPLTLSGPVRRARRRGHGQDARDHAPHRVRRPDRRLQADQRARGDVHGARRGGDAHAAARPRGPGVQARTFHAAALRQLGFFWPQVVGGAAAADAASTRRRLVADAARRVRSRASTARPSATWRRDRVGQGLASSRRTTTRRRRPRRAARRRRAIDPQSVARLITAYEAAKTERGVIDFEDVLLMLADMLAEPQDRRRRGPRAVPALRGRRVPGRLARSSSTCSTSGWAGARSCASSATRQPDHLLVHRRVPAPPARLPPAPTRVAHEVRLVRDYRSTPAGRVAGQPCDRARPRGRRAPARSSCVAQRPAGPAVAYTTYDDDEAEAAGVAAGSRRLIARRCDGRRDRRAVPDQRAVGGVRGGARRRRASRYQVRGGAAVLRA